ncbi:hypothetical protein [Bacillus multifaciens]|uniref:hypothetical protein n=1 Tax=Bacillus multifaciens TaxID=3068506 RepID=UPI0027412704|nr:hypothetical protein [Bacillus sp. WLY-B-L8]MDP7979111.1 hypothetical protein [Bacillus sp. WLY-B-L8]
MCVCNGTGIIRKEIYPGVIATDGCTCEVAKKQESTYKERREARLHLFEEMVQKVELEKQQKAS